MESMIFCGNHFVKNILKKNTQSQIPIYGKKIHQKKENNKRKFHDNPQHERLLKIF
jgi:hypothetical protein